MLGTRQISAKRPEAPTSQTGPRPLAATWMDQRSLTWSALYEDAWGPLAAGTLDQPGGGLEAGKGPLMQI